MRPVNHHRSVVIGGDGEDLLMNTARNGLIYGDSIDGTGTRYKDIFWWSAGAFIMDAGKEDFLQMYGVPLTGGSNSVFPSARLRVFQPPGVSNRWCGPQAKVRLSMWVSRQLANSSMWWTSHK